MKKKWVALVAALLAMTMLLAACASKSESTTEQPAASGETETAAETNTTETEGEAETATSEPVENVKFAIMFGIGGLGGSDLRRHGHDPTGA